MKISSGNIQGKLRELICFSKLSLSSLLGFCFQARIRETTSTEYVFFSFENMLSLQNRRLFCAF